jgi:hypothetical protein
MAHSGQPLLESVELLGQSRIRRDRLDVDVVVQENPRVNEYVLNVDERVTGFAALYCHEDRQLYGASFKITRVRNRHVLLAEII